MQHNATRSALAARFERIRAQTRALCEPLAPDDYLVQSMPDVSPTKWHLAHTTWFFEVFVLELGGEASSQPLFRYLFNSYYQGIGEQYPRARRGSLSRPTLEEIWSYRRTVDDRVLSLLAANPTDAQLDAIDLGLHHEQQHQELILTDIKHVLFQTPVLPSYLPHRDAPRRTMTERPRFLTFDGGVLQVGHAGSNSAGTPRTPGDFSFDNERPRHDVLVRPFELGSRLVTVGEVRAFIDDGGYRRPELWLSDGWAWRNENDIEAPLYWLPEGRLFTLAGPRAHHADEPAVHLSLYEADAIARWAGARLPREEELEVAVAAAPIAGNFVDSGILHPTPHGSAGTPRAPGSGDGASQLYGDAWEWTQSPYAPYPGYAPPTGAIGEYNGKFMCNQHVLRGGSCVTPRDHVRPSYRNFFPAAARWQFSGLRLARDA